METREIKTQASKYWWLTLIIGILAVICGIWVFRNPVESYFALAIYFSFIFLLMGINEIINAFTVCRHRGWGWSLAIGILDLIVGIILMANLTWTANILPYIVGFVLMFTGINFIGVASQMQALRIRSWGWILAGGILTLLFSFLIIFHPLFGAFNIIIWTGLAFLFGGISAIIYSFTIK